MPRTKSFNQEEVLQKAMQLFWRKGYHATSIQDLVNTLEINRASLYDTFGGKQSLFEQAFRLYRETNKGRIIQFLGEQTSVKEGLIKLFEANIAESVSDQEAKGCFTVNTTTELIPGDEKMVAILAENQREFETVFANFLQQGVEKGEISPEKDIEAIAAVLFTLFNGIKVLAKVNPDEKHLMSVVRTTLALLN